MQMNFPVCSQSVNICRFPVAQAGARTGGGNHVNSAGRVVFCILTAGAFDRQSGAGKIITAAHAVAGTPAALIPRAAGKTGAVPDCGQIRIFGRNLAVFAGIPMAD